MEEARFRLDEDSTCYGCKYYKNIDDLDEQVDEDDENEGGICTHKGICGDGIMNGYRIDD